jgi:hypothetical protein
MALKLAEGLVDEVKAYLTANLPAKLDALDAEYRDGITLADVTAIYVGERTLETIDRYPAIFVLADQTVVETWQAAFVDARHRYQVGVIVLHQDTETLGRLVYRYIRAIWELLIEGQTSDALTYELVDEEVRFDFSPIRTGEGNTFTADANITAAGRKQETKP